MYGTVFLGKACDSQPCRNGGECIDYVQDGVQKYLCNCTQFWNGTQCEIGQYLECKFWNQSGKHVNPKHYSTIYIKADLDSLENGLALVRTLPLTLVRVAGVNLNHRAAKHARHVE